MWSNCLLLGQWDQDFSEGNLTAWSGDVQNFIVNDEDQLQLNAPEAGESFIYRASSIMADTISLGFWHSMDFSPSTSNKSRIYLALDAPNVNTASGYFIEMGENGADDALSFYYLDYGTEELIARASMGAIASEPALVRFQVDIDSDGFWSVKTNYEGEDFLSLDIEFMDNRFDWNSTQFFGLHCKYSVSRVDKFFFDDLFLRKFERDLEPPSVVGATLTDDKNIVIQYNEPVELSTATNTMNYQVDNGGGSPQSIMSTNPNDTEFLLSFSTPFLTTETYTLTISGIEDLSGNISIGDTYSFTSPGKPELGDILLSEILFDPVTGGEDFVEIYNASDKNIELDGLATRNDQRDETKLIDQSTIIGPKKYLAFTSDVSFQEQQYKPTSDANIINRSIPAFNNDMGNVMIISGDGIVLDSFDYNEDQHFQLLDDTEGVSLERVSFEVAAENVNNWHSGSQSVRFATPGYKNSNQINTMGNGSDIFTLSTESFSPNLDGSDDLMIMNYALDKNGYVSNLSVYDAAGFLIKQINRNELLGRNGIVIWDGTDEEGKIADLGIYIVAGELFHPDGDVKNVKLTTVLADFLR